MGGGGSKKTGYLSEKNLKAHEATRKASAEIHQKVRQRLSAPNTDDAPPGKKDTGRKRGKKECSPPSSPTYHAPKNGKTPAKQKRAKDKDKSPPASSPPPAAAHLTLHEDCLVGCAATGGGGLHKKGHHARCVHHTAAPSTTINASTVAFKMAGNKSRFKGAALAVIAANRLSDKSGKGKGGEAGKNKSKNTADSNDKHLHDDCLLGCRGSNGKLHKKGHHARCVHHAKSNGKGGGGSGPGREDVEATCTTAKSLAQQVKGQGKPQHKPGQGRGKAVFDDGTRIVSPSIHSLRRAKPNKFKTAALGIIAMNRMKNALAGGGEGGGGGGGGGIGMMAANGVAAAASKPAQQRIFHLVTQHFSCKVIAIKMEDLEQYAKEHSLAPDDAAATKKMALVNAVGLYLHQRLKGAVPRGPPGSPGSPGSPVSPVSPVTVAVA